MTKINPSITKAIREAGYDLRIKPETVHIHDPAYVNIERDKRFEISGKGCVWTLRNSKCIVTLWKNTVSMHVTIY